MKSYHQSMKDLHFTEEEKSVMVEHLMEAAQATNNKKRVLPVRRLTAVGAAAALVLALGAGAAATGVLKSVGEVFADVFGGAPAQTEILDQIGYPVGAEDTVDGVTVTADAILGDTYSYAIVYTIAREDGAPLADGLTPDENSYLPLSFEQSDVDVGHMGGMHGSSYFYDADPADNAIQYVELRTADSPLEPGTAKASLENLSVFVDGDYSNKQTIASGKWSFRFQFAFENCGIQLPAGQTFHMNGMEATLNQVELSPLSFLVEYTVHAPLQESTSATGNELGGATNAEDQSQLDRAFRNLPLTLNRKDGTTLDLSDAGGSVDPQENVTVCQKSGVLTPILDLDEVESITVGDLTISVTQ